MTAEGEKVSIGLRGWTFDPEDVFQVGGELKPVDEMPEEDRIRVVRLTEIMGNACHVCMLQHPDEGWDEWEKATVVYGEPTSEVLLCDDHEEVFERWFFDEGGESYRGTEELQRAFHDWVEEEIVDGEDDDAEDD
jgi:hypothetical protein